MVQAFCSVGQLVQVKVRLHVSVASLLIPRDTASTNLFNDSRARTSTAPIEDSIPQFTPLTSAAAPGYECANRGRPPKLSQLIRSAAHNELRDTFFCSFFFKFPHPKVAGQKFRKLRVDRWDPVFRLLFAFAYFVSDAFDIYDDITGLGEENKAITSVVAV